MSRETRKKLLKAKPPRLDLNGFYKDGNPFIPPL